MEQGEKLRQLDETLGLVALRAAELLATILTVE
jgi:hypothetical protein